MAPELTGSPRTRADVIYAERVLRRKSQEEVAKAAGLDQATVSRAELGRGSDDTYEAIAKALGISLQGVGATS